MAPISRYSWNTEGKVKYKMKFGPAGRGQTMPVGLLTDSDIYPKSSRV